MSKNPFSPYVSTLVQNWARSSLINKITELATRRKLDDLTVGPVLTVSVISVTFYLILPVDQLLQLTMKRTSKYIHIYFLFIGHIISAFMF